MKKIISLTLIAALFTHLQIAHAQKLQPTDVAPSFEMQSVQGKIIHSDQYKGEKVLLTFFRFAGCPVCNYRMHSLIEKYAELQMQNIEVIAIFESENELLAEYVNDANIPFPVIGDSELMLYKKYGTNKSVLKMMRTMFKKEPKQQMKKGEEMYGDKKYKQDGSMIRIPADFLIDENGIISIAHYGKYIGDHLPLDSLLLKNNQSMK